MFRRSALTRSPGAILTTVLLLCGCGTFDEPSPAVPLACSGPFSLYSSEETLISYYGRENVSRGTIDVGEGESEQGTILFAASPNRRIEILWNDPLRRRDLRMIRLRGEVDAWSAFPGVRIGQTLAEVERLNRGAFTLYGFAWDYGGTVADWRDGLLAQSNGEGCRLIVRFGLRDPEGSLDPALSGEEEISSRDARLRKLDPVVDEVILIRDTD